MDQIPVNTSAMTFECIGVGPKLESVAKDTRELMILKNIELPQARTNDGVLKWVLEVLIETTTPDGGTRTSIERLGINTHDRLVDHFKRGDRLEFEGLTARFWSIDGRSGISLSATSVRKIGVPTAPPKPTPNGNKPELANAS